MYLQRLRLLQKSNGAFKKMTEKRKVSVNDVYVCACGSPKPAEVQNDEFLTENMTFVAYFQKGSKTAAPVTRFETYEEFTARKFREEGDNTESDEGKECWEPKVHVMQMNVM